MARTSQKTARKRLALASDESEALRNTISEVLPEGYALALDAGGEADVRVVAPVELAACGARLLRRHRLRHPEVPVLVITPDDASAGLVRDCFRHGAEDVLAEDEVDATLEPTLMRALQRHGQRQADEDQAATMAAELGKRARELGEALAQLESAYDSTLGALVSALDLREEETACHSQRVALYALLLGLRAGLTGEACENLYRGSLLHDIGKIGIPDAVLLKPGKFDEHEWAIMRRHAEMGDAMLRDIDFLASASEVPRSHHEAWNGQGYPDGLEGQDIPLSARLFAIVDSYDAIRSRRPYKEPMSYAEAVECLRRVSGKRLDPHLVELFLAEPESSWELLAQAALDNNSYSAALAACQGIPTP